MTATKLSRSVESQLICVHGSCKHACMDQYWASTGPMLGASAQYWSDTGPYRHVYGGAIQARVHGPCKHAGPVLVRC